jgi:hypothetical protein
MYKKILSGKISVFISTNDLCYIFQPTHQTECQYLVSFSSLVGYLTITYVLVSSVLLLSSFPHFPHPLLNLHHPHLNFPHLRCLPQTMLENLRFHRRNQSPKFIIRIVKFLTQTTIKHRGGCKEFCLEILEEGIL